MSFSPQKILIVKLGSLGDVVHSLPVLSTLRQQFPKAFIAWAVDEKAKDILHKNPHLDELIVLRTQHWRRHWNSKTFQELRCIIRSFRCGEFDTVLDLQGLIKSGIIAALTKAQKRIGFHRKDCREWPNIFFLNHRASFFGTNNHVVEKNLSLLKLLGIAKFQYHFPINIPEEAESYATQFFNSHPELETMPVAAINPGVGFKTKSWNLKRFAQLADKISEKLGCNILLTWGPNEKGKVDTIGGAMTKPYWIAPPTTVFQSLAIYRRLNLFIGCDTGPLHLCAALGVPTVSIFGPTDPIRNGAYGTSHRAVFKKLHCSYCYKRSCPTQNECMDSVQVEDVFDAVQKSIYNLGKEIASYNPSE